MANTYTKQEINDFMINVGYDTEAEAIKAMNNSDEYENEKATLLPELIRYYDGNVELAKEIAEEMAWGLVYA